MYNEICRQYLKPFQKGNTICKGRIPWNKGKHYSTGKICPDEVKKKISETEKGKVVSSETKQKMRIAKLGCSLSEKHKLNIGKALSGEVSSFWKGGITSLHDSIRKSLENDIWRDKIFKRDNYTCQECFKQGGNLHAHHKKAFALILKEFLQTYSQFSPLEDKETLVRLAITYEPFWDVNNGETKCEDCHICKGVHSAKTL